MVDRETLRRLVEALPSGHDASTERALTYLVAGKGLAWTWNERVHPKKPRVPRLDVLAVRCSFERREMLLDTAPDRFFIDDHYRGYAGVLVRLDAIDEDEMAGMLEAAWRMVAPKALVKARDLEG
ncbi:MAG: MmcQ/YjbR family DNA-binding protein [Phenylobacterium sp.]|uniref:MmcQ/YjbR family DNA-binding protein n=1 Tax=Phenylobacterium sp. TaxID=1871053 RepID=UPI0025DCD820|nr:MmcQ/YjbR family DNA-binding protein [Phenylobacterium sp.]MBI1198791.1 MmcQ/YjbR family DNA-binding protein [Phenylobacterium sp.]